MGWKAFKEHYKIGHRVEVRGEFLKIGSPYVSELITIEMATGQIVSTKLGPPFNNDDLDRYYKEINSDQ